MEPWRHAGVAGVRPGRRADRRHRPGRGGASVEPCRGIREAGRNVRDHLLGERRGTRSIRMPGLQSLTRGDVDRYSCARRRRSALPITDTELNVIAALAQIGLISTDITG